MITGVVWNVQKRPGREVDHIKALQFGGALLDPANCQTLCRGCHITKTRRENTKPNPEREQWRRFMLKMSQVEHACYNKGMAGLLPMYKPTYCQHTDHSNLYTPGGYPMTDKQKLELRQSVIRSRLAEIAGVESTPEIRSRN